MAVKGPGFFSLGPLGHGAISQRVFVFFLALTSGAGKAWSIRGLAEPALNSAPLGYPDQGKSLAPRRTGLAKEADVVAGLND